ncbi:putative transposase [Streptococcus suis D12]|uniref:Putative transposase n=1 Tax=Streptococcus suis D12 TaxID=1004952 RepID=G7SE84_STRSU|nr:putative transposase [Streptococcus suis D12]
MTFRHVPIQKTPPNQFYELHFRMVRLEIKPGFFETLVTNTDYLQKN